MAWFFGKKSLRSLLNGVCRELHLGRYLHELDVAAREQMLFFISSRFYVAALAPPIPGIAKLLEGWLVHPWSPPLGGCCDGTKFPNKPLPPTTLGFLLGMKA